MASPVATLVSGFARIDSDTLVGLSVASARNMYKQGASIPDSARATVNGAEAADGQILAEGDIITFDEPTGTKGK